MENDEKKRNEDRDTAGNGGTSYAGKLSEQFGPNSYAKVEKYRPYNDAKEDEFLFDID